MYKNLCKKIFEFVWIARYNMGEYFSRVRELDEVDRAEVYSKSDFSVSGDRVAASSKRKGRVRTPGA